MRKIAIVMTLATATWVACAQGGSGAPSPIAQSPVPQSASAAERAVERRHEKLLERSKSRRASRASKAASGSNE